MLPALVDLHQDLKHEPLSVTSLPHLRALEPAAVLVDAVENPGQAWSVLTSAAEIDLRAPSVVVVDRDHLERFPWHGVADEFFYPGAPEAELRVRLAMLRRRSGAGQGAVVRLGPLAIDTDTYRVSRRRRAVGPDVQGVRAPALPRDAPGPGRHEARRCSARSGATTSTEAPGPSTSTSDACGPSSAPNTSI